ncbi:MAG: serine/threonine-protein kinase [Myxococcota bacterium]|nr:serine/threonine-protein kinase [Myxococcota bacterium]
MSERLEAKQTLGDYEILSTIKTGGMGEVLMGRKQGVFGFEKLVAIKTIRSDLRKHEDLKKMFLDEAHLLSRLEHPAITQVHDFGENKADDILYLVMEYVSGEPLSEILTKRQAALPIGVAVRYMDEVLRGLHAAHELKDLNGESYGVVHRDISPQNLILTFEGRAKIIDFGIALMRDREAPATSLGMPKGKPAYMSPEQINSEHIDRRTDIFAAGVVLHETLTGKRLFRAESIAQTIRKVLDSNAPKPSEINPGIPPELDAIVLKALERDRDKRFENSLEFAEALSALAPDFKEDTLESFARIELASELEQHRSKLQGLLHPEDIDTTRPAARGRPRDMQTVQAKASNPVQEALNLSQSGATPKAPPIQRILTKTRYMVDRPMVRWMLPLIFLGSLLGLIVLSQKTHSSPPGTKVVMKNGMPTLVAPKQNLKRQTSTKKRQNQKAKTTKSNKKKATRKHINKKAPKAAQKTEPSQAITPPPSPQLQEPSQSIEYGTVTIGANPWALVKIDGKNVGNTPLLGKQIPSGKHLIELIAPDSEAVRYKTEIVLKTGQHLRIKAPE